MMFTRFETQDIWKLFTVEISNICYVIFYNSVAGSRRSDEAQLTKPCKRDQYKSNFVAA